MAYATFNDVKKRFPRPLTASSDLVDALLEDAEVRLLARIPTLKERITAGDVEARLVTGIICDAVIRVLKNPNSIRSTGVDDGQVTIDTTVSSGRLYFTDEELDMLAARVPLSGVYMIPLDPPYWDR